MYVISVSQCVAVCCRVLQYSNTSSLRDRSWFLAVFVESLEPIYSIRVKSAGGCVPNNEVFTTHLRSCSVRDKSSLLVVLAICREEGLLQHSLTVHTCLERRQGIWGQHRDLVTDQSSDTRCRESPSAWGTEHKKHVHVSFILNNGKLLPSRPLLL